jgi:penicillin-binding protein 1A
MVSAYSAFPNKGIRVEPHMIRKVADRDGVTLDEWHNTTYKVMNEYVALTMVSMMRGVVEIPGATANAAQSLGVQVAGKTGTVNDHTDVWFIGYTPTYVTGVWMGYPGRKKPLGDDMTGGHGALPFFVDFMKDYLKDKPKEKFDKAPEMPEDMKELQKQRQRELAEERAELAAKRAAMEGDDQLLPSVITNPNMEQLTLPPSKDEAGPPPPKPSTEASPRHLETTAPGATGTGAKTGTGTGSISQPAITRPREVDAPVKKKGKKGEGEP